VGDGGVVPADDGFDARGGIAQRDSGQSLERGAKKTSSNSATNVPSGDIVVFVAVSSICAATAFGGRVAHARTSIHRPVVEISSVFVRIAYIGAGSFVSIRSEHFVLFQNVTEIVA
jgi:hypothetical protein